ncbi:MAG: glycosyltransferase family 4 protein [bacterium]|nr:glycosyltransferase family 4 protein [bacterium]
MKICIDISQAVYEGTGSGRYVIELVKNLLLIDPENEYVLFGSAMRKNQSLLAILDHFKSLDSNKKVSVKNFTYPPKFFEIIWNKFNILKIERFVGEVDIVHSSDWTQPPTRAVTVTTVHDLIPFLFEEYVHPRILKAHKARWKWIQNSNVYIIVDALSTKKDIIEKFAISDERIAVVPLACDERFFEFGEKNIKGLPIDDEINNVLRKYNVNCKNYILSVGTLEPRKNIHKLIEAYSNLCEQTRSQYPLLIVGKKSWDGEIPNCEGVHFTGYISDDVLPLIYAGAKCFIMPSLYEGFGLPMLEAMASGTAVICSNNSSLIEIGGQDVHYIENPKSAESIRVVLEHVLQTEGSDNLIEINAAYLRARTFSWKRTAMETLDVYNRLGNV